jgi:hypothetical protein
MTEQQKRTNTVAVSMLLKLRKAGIERVADPGFRKANLQHAVETIRQAELRDRGHRPKLCVLPERAVHSVADRRLQTSFWSGEHGAR